MAIKKFVVGCFDDEAVLFPAVKKVRKAGYKIHDVYTPFPDSWPGSGNGYCVIPACILPDLFMRITGTTTALGFMSWVFTKDWPLNIGGKPHFRIAGMDSYYI